METQQLCFAREVKKLTTILELEQALVKKVKSRTRHSNGSIPRVWDTGNYHSQSRPL